MFRWITNHSGSVSVIWVLGLVLLREVPAAAQTPRCQPANESQDEDTNPFNPDRPGIADGSTVIGPGRYQLEAGVQQEFRRADGSTEHRHFVPTLFRVGISCHWEARFESNTFTQVDTFGPEGVGDRTLGMAPVSAGVKLNIRADPNRLKLGTILRVFPASGTDGVGGTKHVTGDLRLAADWDLPGGLSLNPNAGLARYEDDDNHKTFAAGVFALTLSEFNKAKTLGPFIDVGVVVPEASIPGSSFIADAGVVYLPCRNVQVDVSAGTGPHGRTPPRLFVSVGISVRFRA